MINITYNGSVVTASISTSLNGGKTAFGFEFDTGSEWSAEMLAREIQDSIARHNADVAKRPISYLQPQEITVLKSYLNKHWDGHKNEYKF